MDLGTTFSAAAVCREGRVEMASLGARSTAVPSVVFLDEQGELLVGDVAVRRGLAEPERMAREFKRRLGDSVPVFLGASPLSADLLLGRLLASVVASVTEAEGGAPERVAVAHPANWGPYKLDLLREAVRVADLTEVVFVAEPVAAATSYAARERVEPGEIVAVYDLGGGTFDAAVLRRTVDGFEILGQPEGVERLGGIDFDAAVFAHVERALGDAFERLDSEEPRMLRSLARLRQECVEAKEALSLDSVVAIDVVLPGIHTEIRLTRTEFEAMVRPAIARSVDGLRRALRSARVEPDAVASVLLVGGSSRIPLVAEVVAEGIGRPVAVDAHPKHVVALGAALTASGAAEPPVAHGGAPPSPSIGVRGPSAGSPEVPSDAAGGPLPELGDGSDPASVPGGLVATSKVVPPALQSPSPAAETGEAEHVAGPVGTGHTPDLPAGASAVVAPPPGAPFRRSDPAQEAEPEHEEDDFGGRLMRQELPSDPLVDVEGDAPTTGRRRLAVMVGIPAGALALIAALWMVARVVPGDDPGRLEAGDARDGASVGDPTLEYPGVWVDDPNPPVLDGPYVLETAWASSGFPADFPLLELTFDNAPLDELQGGVMHCDGGVQTSVLLQPDIVTLSVEGGKWVLGGSPALELVEVDSWSRGYEWRPVLEGDLTAQSAGFEAGGCGGSGPDIPGVSAEELADTSRWTEPIPVRLRPRA